LRCSTKHKAKQQAAKIINMKNRIIRLTESDVERLVKKIIKETEDGEEVPQGQDNPKDVEKFLELADQYLFNKYGAYAEKIDTTKEKAMIIAALAKKWGVESGDLSKVKSILNTESSLRRKNLINEININDTVKKLKAKGKVEPHEEEKLLDYISKKIDGNIKGNSIKGDGFMLNITNKGFNVNKKSDKKRMFNFDQIGDMVKYIKESKLDEVGGYDDKNIMAIHAGASMDSLANSFNELTITVEDLANAVANGDSKSELIEYLEKAFDINNFLIKDIETVINDFTEDDVIKSAKNMIVSIKRFNNKIDAITNFSDAMGNDEKFTERVKELLIELLPSLQEFGDQLQITGHEFKHRLAGHGRGSFGSGFSNN